MNVREIIKTFKAVENTHTLTWVFGSAFLKDIFIELFSSSNKQNKKQILLKGNTVLQSVTVEEHVPNPASIKVLLQINVHRQTN